MVFLHWNNDPSGKRFDENSAHQRSIFLQEKTVEIVD